MGEPFADGATDNCGILAQPGSQVGYGYEIGVIGQPLRQPFPTKKGALGSATVAGMTA
jgi:hypothetical protein